MTFADLVARARELAAGPGRAVLGIVGSPGSGKSTLAAALLRELPAAAHVPMDGFHLADVALRRIGRLDAKGAPDTFDAGGYAALLRRLLVDDEEVVYAPAFERDLEQPLAGAIAVPAAARLIVTEGNYLLLGPEHGAWSALAPLLTETWFCAPDPAARSAQLLARHVEFGKAPDAARAWIAAVDEPNALLVDGTRDRADLVIGPDVLGSLRP